MTEGTDVAEGPELSWRRILERSPELCAAVADQAAPVAILDSKLAVVCRNESFARLAAAWGMDCAERVTLNCPQCDAILEQALRRALGGENSEVSSLCARGPSGPARPRKTARIPSGPTTTG